MEARYETALEEYVKTLRIEALTMSQMARRDIFPGVSRCLSRLADGISAQRIACKDLPCAGETKLLQSLSALLDQAFEKADALDFHLSQPEAHTGEILAQATYYKDAVLPAMDALRAVVDQMESRTDASLWPYPSYGQLMFQV